MGGFECYCAVCCASLRWCDAIGSASPRALERRDRRVAKKRLRLKNGEDGDSSDSESEEDEEEEDEDDLEADEPDWYPEEEDRLYDPRLVSEEETQWLSDSRCLGFNPEADGVNRAFLTSHASLQEYGRIAVSPGTDPAQPSELEYDCYETYDESQLVVFPFHPPCYEILSRTISSLSGVSKIDKNILYDAMSRLSKEPKRHLDINYGNLSGNEQFWAAIPGEEFSVANPLDVDDFQHHLAEKIDSGTFELSQDMSLDASEPGSQEASPFVNLPSLIIRCIANYLKAHDVLSFSSAFQSVYWATQDSHFWKRMLLNDMPWLWDSKDVFDNEKSPQLDYRALYFWLDEATAPIFGTGSPFMAIANRRRIWDASQQLEATYSRLAKLAVSLEPSRDIVEKARCPYMVKVTKTELSKAAIRLQEVFWVHSWQEISDFPTIIETFWNGEDALIGINCIVGTSQRMFGSKTAGLGPTKEALRLGAGQWISGMHLHLKSRTSSSGADTVVVTGITFELEDKANYKLGKTAPALGIRPILVSEGQCLVGITGQLNSDGTLARLGILECSKDSIGDAEALKNQEFNKERAFWAPSNMVPTRGAFYSDSSTVWSHAHLGFLAIFPNPISDLEENLEPYEILLWAKDIQELSKLHQISAQVSLVGILGLSAEYIERYWEPKRSLGKKIEGEPGTSAAGENSAIQSLGLNVDGAAGEIIVQIGVPQGEELTGIMLSTNQGNSVVFGEDNRTWSTHQAPEGRREDASLEFLRRSEAIVSQK
ncbi:hypothetical protein BGZ63DRAFT_428354 [Mariannaea sp. PMI_226]|nr:hypothetical protein BGZ63DRAFT_428354 [Mariannaea sp. PMI_226]